MEDIGIVLGKALKQSSRRHEGIARYGQASVPMDEALASVSLDISGRPYFVYKVEFPKKSKLKDFNPDLIEDFLQAFVSNSSITLHITVLYGRNIHHIIEAVFKGLGRALREAVSVNRKIKSIPTTKGSYIVPEREIKKRCHCFLKFPSMRLNMSSLIWTGLFLINILMITSGSILYLRNMLKNMT